MSEEPQPELRWAPIPPKPSRKGRVWLMIGLVVAALLIVGVLLFFLLPRGETPSPGASATSSPTPSSAETPIPSSSPTSSPSIPPVSTPPTADPTVDAFRQQVGGWLGDAGRGLDIIAQAGGQDALSVIDTLQEDGQRLSDAQAPSSIEQSWRDGVDAYVQKLAALRTAVVSGGATSGAVDDARSAANSLVALVGL
ncbi:hypothetical protein GCM10009651_09390 [Microbacterium natoriense]|uniref:hypothetical protein n=1 Tax=Microbacterium natoriense TaxID=284570 RepID=UPI0031DE3D47